MNKAIKEVIASLVRTLPPLESETETIGVSVKGSKVIENWTDPTNEPQLEDGSPINPNKYYRYIIPKPVDHEKNLKDMYRKDGVEGIEKYKSMVQKAYAESIIKQSKDKKNENISSAGTTL